MFPYSAEVGVRLGHGLKLDEVPEARNLVQMDADVSPEQQAAGLLDGDKDPEGGRERFLEAVWVVDRDEPIVAHALDRLIGALVLDQLGRAVLLAQLQSPVLDPEVGIELLTPALVRGAERERTSSERAGSGSWAFSSMLRAIVRPLHPVPGLSPECRIDREALTMSSVIAG